MPSLQPHTDDGNFGAGAVAGRRFYDNATGTWMVKVFPGEFYVSRQSDEVLVTVLGSCVSACIRDSVRGIGGMNHFMLPHDSTGRWGDDQKSTRFGNFAMEQLINELIKAGCVRERMEIKLFGGGNVTDTSNAVGTENADFVLKYLKDEGLRHAVADLGGTQPRRIHYYPVTGRVTRRLLGNTDKYAVTRDEKEYRSRLKSQPTHGDIELFGDT
jgi:chemotaxis protein CheD